MGQIKENIQELEQKMMELRGYKVVKSNDLIQKARFQLSLQEQKVILYLISKIQPNDNELKEHEFFITEFCNICGIDKDNGKNYKNVKNTIKTLADKSAWIKQENDSETLFRWINTATIKKKSGVISIKLHEKLRPYLLQLKERFTQYELLYTLAMRSQYSVRMYEILRSYEYQRYKKFEIEDLKHILAAENYGRYPDFKRKVLDIAIREINDLSDLTVTYKIIKEGRRYAKIEFYILIKKNMEDRLKTWANIDEIINPV